LVGGQISDLPVATWNHWSHERRKDDVVKTSRLSLLKCCLLVAYNSKMFVWCLPFIPKNFRRARKTCP
jgi:hypothetical protein